MKTQKLANFNDMQTDYKAELRKYFLGEFILQVVVGLVATYTCSYYFVSKVLNLPFGLFWIVSGFIFVACMMIPLMKAALPRKPSPDDVEADRALRRAFKMDDSVREE